MSQYGRSPTGSGCGSTPNNEDDAGPSAINDNASDSDASSPSESGGSNFEPELEHDKATAEPEEEDIVDEIAKSNQPKMPMPPMELFRREAEEFVMEFMFQERPRRMREADMEFWCLQWKPVTIEILIRSCEYLSGRLVALMNENAELERHIKGLGPRRTSVLTEAPYGLIDAKLIHRERWDRDDVVWCICEGVKKFPKELSRNQRFKARLRLPVPGKDYEVVRGVVNNELRNPKLKEYKKEDEEGNKENKAPLKAKAAGSRRKAAATKPAAAASTKKKPTGKQAKNTGKRAANDDDSDGEFRVTNSSPKKKGRTMTKKANTAAASTPKKTSTPRRSRNVTGGKADTQSTIKKAPKRAAASKKGSIKGDKDA